MPSVTFSKGGLIKINKQAAMMMGIADGTRVAFAQDQEDPANWYIYQDKEGFECRLAYNKKDLLFNHKTFCVSLKEALGLDEKVSHRFKIAGQPTEIKGTQFWGMIQPV